jgi:hypothetical protein
MKRMYLLTLALIACLLLGAGLAAAQIVPLCPPQSPNLTAGFGKKGPGTVIGNVTVSNDADNLYVQYNVTAAGWTLTETQVSICTSPFQNRPAPGLAPYKDAVISGNSALYIIPLNNVLLDPSCGGGGPISLNPCDWIYIAAHAAVTGPSGAETAYGGTCTGSSPAPNPGNKSWFCQIEYQICCDTTVPPPGENACEETAWAKAANDSICFNALPDLKISKWGWTNKLTASGTYTLDLWAAAGQCDTSKGTLVGTVTVVYDKDAHTATVTYSITEPGHKITEAHLSVGGTQLPLVGKGKKGAPSAAPGLFPYLPDISADGLTATAIVSQLPGTIYVAAHAVVDGFDCPPLPTVQPPVE